MGENEYAQFIESSFTLLSDYERRGRYFHSLRPDDNSPVVVHKQTNQYTYIIAGEGRVFLNGVEHRIVTGDGIFIEAGTNHRFIADSAEIMLFHIHIPDEGRDSDRYIVQGDDYERYKA